MLTNLGFFCSIFSQGEQFMVWHNFLQIDESYIFQKLRETTMNKVWII